jgi:plasmid stabilization system protein ParE
MRFRVLHGALDDIDELTSWVEEHHGLSFALSTRGDIFATFDLLTKFPHLGRVRPETTNRPVRFFLLKPYWIVYEPGDPLLIHRVLHGARDLSRLL